MVLERDRRGRQGRARSIPVDEARALPEFFSKSPASAPLPGGDHRRRRRPERQRRQRRAEDPGGAAASAACCCWSPMRPGGLLPTIRSRCRRLAFAPAGPEARGAPSCAAATDVDRGGRAAPGAAWPAARPAGRWTLAAGEALEHGRRGARAAGAACRRSTRPRRWRWPTASAAGRAQAQFDLLFDRLAERVHGCAVDRAAQEGRARSTAGREAWETLQRLPREVEALNLDRADAFFTALGELRAAARA